MLRTPRFKIAFIGSHGVGKTTLCYGLAARLKGATSRSRWCTRWRGGARCRSTRRRRSRRSRGSSTPRSPRSWSPRRGTRWWSATAACSTTTSTSSSPPAGRSGPERLVEYWIQGYDLLVHVPIVETPEPGRRPLPRSRVPARRRGAAGSSELAERRLPSCSSTPGRGRTGWTRSSGRPGSGCGRPSSRCHPYRCLPYRKSPTPATIGAPWELRTFFAGGRSSPTSRTSSSPSSPSAPRATASRPAP